MKMARDCGAGGGARWGDLAEISVRPFISQEIQVGEFIKTKELRCGPGWVLAKKPLARYRNAFLEYAVGEQVDIWRKHKLNSPVIKEVARTIHVSYPVSKEGLFIGLT